MAYIHFPKKCVHDCALPSEIYISEFFLYTTQLKPKSEQVTTFMK